MNKYITKEAGFLSKAFKLVVNTAQYLGQKTGYNKLSQKTGGKLPTPKQFYLRSQRGLKALSNAQIYCVNELVQSLKNADFKRMSNMFKASRDDIASKIMDYRKQLGYRSMFANNRRKLLWPQYQIINNTLTYLLFRKVQEESHQMIDYAKQQYKNVKDKLIDS